MDINDKEYELLARYIVGECSKKEMLNVRDKMKNNKEYAELVQHLIMFRDTRKSVIQQISAQSSWIKLEKKIEKAEMVNRTAFKENSTRPTKYHSIILKRKTFWLARVAAILLVAGLTALFTYIHIDTTRDYSLSDKQEVVTKKGQRSNIHLNDGSRILVNSSSRISYLPFTLSETSRVMQLSGEAYFNVVGESRPFLVYADDVVIEVLGTSFAIRSIKGEDNIKVAVSNGKVSVRYVEKRDGDEYLLEKGDMLTISRDHSKSPVLEQNIDIDRILGWVDYRFEFDNVTLEFIAKELERIYGVAIELIDPAMRQRRITTRFEGESLKKVLGVISIALNLEYEIHDDRVLLYEKSVDFD